MYLEIRRRIDRRIDNALGFDTPQSRLLRSCPSCFYMLDGEPNLKFSCLLSMDGNNSLKRLGSHVRDCQERLDSRFLDSDRWLTHEAIDRFKDEVKQRPVCSLLFWDIF